MARGPQLLLWLLVPVCLALNFYANWVLFFALLAGVLRRFGKPIFAKEELKKYMFSQDFQMIGFMSVASLANTAALLMVLSPVLIHGFLTCSKILEFRD